MERILQYPVGELFDPVQTHAAYQVPVEQVDAVKQALKAKGATRFRVVKTPSGLVIVCFKLKKAVDTASL